MKYLNEQYPQHFDTSDTWVDMSKKLPKLNDDKEINRCRMIAGNDYILSLTTKNKKDLPFPLPLKLKLNHYVGLHYGVFIREWKTPVRTI